MKYAIMILLLAGCTRQAKEAEAEATYLGQQLKCIDDFNTRHEIDQCRANVRARWGIVETVAKDGGR